MRWTIGVSTGAWVDRPILEVLGWVQETGIQAVEIGTPVRHFDPWRHQQIAAVGRFLAETGIHPLSIHAPFGGLLDLSDPNPHHRHAAVGGILTAASALKQLGGRIVVVHPSDVPRERQDVQQRLDHCLEALAVLARACVQSELTLAIETPLPHLIGGHPDEFAWLLRGLDDSAHVCLDTSHTTIGGCWHRFVQLAGERLAHVHANDHRGHADDHLPPGDGIIDWPDIIRTLRAVGYEGAIILELNRPTDGPPAFLRRACSQFQRLVSIDGT
jgi:sugar phosphate isomerase/epimerase